MLSPDGACKSFDASANGYARAEGVACVILKRSDVQDVPWIVPHDPYCTIMAIGSNNDGYTPQGITFPSGESQYELGTQVSIVSTLPGYHTCQSGCDDHLLRVLKCALFKV